MRNLTPALFNFLPASCANGFSGQDYNLLIYSYLIF